MPVRSVIILGAGIAGLGAAWKLAREGVPVTVIEAKPVIGGRIRTLYRNGLPIELGAEFIHGRSPALLDAIDTAGLSVHSAADGYWLFENGELRQEEVWDEVGRTIRQADPHSPDVSFSDFLLDHSFDRRTARLARGFVEGFDAAYPDRISTHSLLRAHYSSGKMEGTWAGRIDKGYGMLVAFLADEIRRLGGVLITGSEARLLRWKPGNVEVMVTRGRNISPFRASSVIITLPLGVLKDREFQITPRVPDKEEAAHELEIGDVAKVVFLFREKWWPSSIGGFIQALDEPFPTWWTDPRGPVLTAWAGGPKADAVMAFSSDFETLGSEIMGRIFDERPSVIRSMLVDFYIYNWAADPHIQGAYSYIPVNGMDLPKVLATSVEETLYFAGEATVSDAQTGTVFGGFETGLRAATEVLENARTPA